MCQCDACLKVGSARADPGFMAMQTSAGLAAEAAAAEAEWPGEQGWELSDAGGGRLLLQSQDTMVQAVLDAVGTLQASQAQLQQQVQALQAAVADAAAAAADTSVAKLIAVGQAQIASRQAAIQGILGEILGKQTVAAAAAAAQMQVLANLQSLQQQQLAAQAQLEQSAKDQTSAIAIALQQGMLTPRWVGGQVGVEGWAGAEMRQMQGEGTSQAPVSRIPSLPPHSQALELYRRVRVQTLAATKASLLASLPCTATTVTEHTFDVEQYPEVCEGNGLQPRLQPSSCPALACLTSLPHAPLPCAGGRGHGARALHWHQQPRHRRPAAVQPARPALRLLQLTLRRHCWGMQEG